MLIENPVIAPVASLPATGTEGQLVVVHNVGAYFWVNGAWTATSTGTISSDAVVEGTTHLFFTNARAIAAPLTGFTVGTNTAVTATDTTLAAFGKVQGSLNALSTSIGNNTTALAGKEPTITAGTNTQFWRGDKTWQTLTGASVGLGNVDNTSDVNKPVSTATTTALAAKLSLNGTTTMTGAFNEAPTVSLAAASTTNIGGAAANAITITGTATINVFDNVAVGIRRLLLFTAATPLTHNATSLILPGATNITTAAGDSAEFISLGSGNWRCVRYTRSTSQVDIAPQAVKLQTARTINGVAFDGTANITVADGTKEPSITAGTTAQYRRGDKSWQDLGTATRAVALTGFVTSSSAAVTATDSIVVGMGKLQSQVNSATGVAVAVAAMNLDLSAGSYFTKTITASGTFSVSNVPASGIAGSIALEITNGGSQTIAWWPGITWASGVAPTLTTAGVDVIGFYTINGGTTWRGILMANDIK